MNYQDFGCTESLAYKINSLLDILSRYLNVWCSNTEVNNMLC